MLALKPTRPRRTFAFVATVASAVLAIASVAWACTVPYGQTYYDDETVSKSIYYGDSVSFHGHGAYTRGGTARYVGVTGTIHDHDGDGKQEIGEPCMYDLVGETHEFAPYSNGDLHSHTAAITRSPARYGLCYYEVTSSCYGCTSTGAAYLYVY